MKTFIIGLLILFNCTALNAQEKMTQEQARSICAQEMAAFTKAVAFAYQKGNSFEQFQFALCGKSPLTFEGSSQLKVAYNFLVQGASNDLIIRTYPGKEIAASLNYLANEQKKGLQSDGAELFGGKTGDVNSSFAKSGNGCKWYQLWCMMQSIASWVVMNLPAVSVMVTILNGPWLP